jgi:hypothetical protein
MQAPQGVSSWEKSASKIALVLTCRARMKEDGREEKKRPCSTRVRGLSLSFLSFLELLSVVVTYLLQMKQERRMQGSKVENTLESHPHHSGRRLGRPAL